MGISGLLPVLRSITHEKHLSEFAGQTLAVDAYVWLHRGVHTCAVQLATAVPTHKYVDYAMHRVRLLRYHKITPFIVFDGGPLAAKKGTELERKQKRTENLARANALASEGKHGAAREFYIKCVDVTPQMAYQLIKALRAESVAYIVSPYEADAQMAYLELMGLVDGIITEDSDLLVFGCKVVLFKLDASNSTISSISRAEFGSVTDYSPESNGISLVGWSDVQFRHMSILSGCDYLPSIPGIGLKTAWTLLRKCKTASGVVRAIRMEGKKTVPRDYMAKFTLAEQCFLHQRVYDPDSQRLVHLTPVVGSLSPEANAYVGADIKPSLAKQIAVGDVDPTTFQPIVDINPGYRPSAPNTLSFFPNSLNKKDADKGKNKGRADTKPSGSILDFFGSKPIIPRSGRKSPVKPTSITIAGMASGKRTLADLMEQETVSTRKKKKIELNVTQSHFFGGSSMIPSSRNVSMPDELPVSDWDDLEEKENFDIQTNEEVLDVIQEDGYLSPSGTSRCISNLSSPISRENIEDDFGADILSSPVAAPQPNYAGPSTRLPRPNTVAGPSSATLDLEELCADDMTSEIDCSDDEANNNTIPHSCTETDGPDLSEPDDVQALATQAVANGWRRQYSLKRSETNVTPESLHRHSKSYTRPPALNPSGRRSLAWVPSGNMRQRPGADPSTTTMTVGLDLSQYR